VKTDAEIRDTIRKFVIENFLMGDGSAMPADDQSFLETGTIDSIGALELVEFLEGALGIQVKDTDLVRDNLDSVDNLARFVGRRLVGG